MKDMQMFLVFHESANSSYHIVYYNMNEFFNSFEYHENLEEFNLTLVMKYTQVLLSERQPILNQISPFLKR